MPADTKISRDRKTDVCQIADAMKALWRDFAEKETFHSRKFPTCKVGGRHQRRWISDLPEDRIHLPAGMDASRPLYMPSLHWTQDDKPACPPERLTEQIMINH